VIQGTLEQLHLGDLMQWLQMGRLSGRLTLIDRGRERRLDFLEGRVVFVSSQVPEERFATWLAREGLLPLRQLQQILGSSMLRRMLFTNVLIEEAGIATEDLRSSLARLAETISARILVAPRVRFILDPTYPVRDLLHLDLNLEPNALLMEAARRSDESSPLADGSDEDLVPFRGDAFEEFFWSLIGEGVDGSELVDGEQLVELHTTVRNIMATLAQWLASSPGLVPLPDSQVDGLTQDLEADRTVRLHGRPHSAWNQMVLSCSIRSAELPPPTTLEQLQNEGEQLNLWLEMCGVKSWHRPSAGRLDELTASAVSQWADAAVAAAPHLSVDPGTAALAVHLISVPTDLVLWVLGNLPVGHQRLRQTLLRRIPQRVGAALALLADFPSDLQALMLGRTPSLLGVCLQLAREPLLSGSLWPATVPEDEQAVDEVAPQHARELAAKAARELLERSAANQAATG
jgi:hypothetical protein